MATENWEVEIDLSEDAEILGALCSGQIDLLVAERRFETLDHPVGRLLQFPKAS